MDKHYRPMDLDPEEPSPIFTQQDNVWPEWSETATPSARTEMLICTHVVTRRLSCKNVGRPKYKLNLISQH